MFPSALKHLIDAFGKINGVGPKTALRYALHTAYFNRHDGAALLRALQEVQNTLHDCTVCFTIADAQLCHICAATTRNKSIVCVVASPQEVETIEKAGTYEGVYHVLQGLLSQAEGIDVADIKIEESEKRIAAGGISELILAMSPTVEGEITAHYLQKKLKGLVKISRIARGLPMGSLLEYMDDATIAEALRDRKVS